MKITENFSLEEFHCEDGTPYPKEWIKTRLEPLCRALEVLREYLGDHPLIITSGYRTPEHNRKVGGVRNSQHVQGRAADIKCKSKRPVTIANMLKQLMDDGLIPKGGIGLYRYKTIVHYDIRGKRASWSKG